MRVLIAPDSYGDTLTAAAAASAIADGWSAARPDDDLVQAPCSDGGPGFVEVLSRTIGSVAETEVDGPIASRVNAQWLLDRDEHGVVAYIESAQACGLHLLGGPPTPDSAMTAHSRGVGQLVAAAAQAGARRIVVGLGGSACTDGGRGFVDVLGGLDGAGAILADIEVIAATDVENPLLGRQGAAYVFGPQKGADENALSQLERRNAEWAQELERSAGRRVDSLTGAGAAGGLGAALLALGASRVSGADVVAERTSQSDVLSVVDLVITGEGRLDGQSLRGKVVSALAARARRHGIPVVALAGRVDLEAGDLMNAGIADARDIVSVAGSVEVAMADAARQLSRLARMVASEYSPERLP